MHDPGPDGVCRECGQPLRRVIAWVHDRADHVGWAGTPHEAVPASEARRLYLVDGA
jgi:hypothetical protein